MSGPHFFDANALDWTPHPRFPTLLTKPLETKATYDAASVMLVQVAVGGVIDTHTHIKETETVYIMGGEARLVYGEAEHLLKAGSGVTIPPGIPHSVHNLGETTLEIFAIHIPPVR